MSLNSQMSQVSEPKKTVNGPIEACRSRLSYKKSEMVAGCKEDVAVLAHQRPVID
jgi:hypothetical protein